ncbi:MAG: hypothetical protein K8F36_12690 [Melioribacteraceae bacterium]|nr:hypothetical protein [Melioribacteraceae bacterium]
MKLKLLKVAFALFFCCLILISCSAVPDEESATTPTDDSFIPTWAGGPAISVASGTLLMPDKERNIICFGRVNETQDWSHFWVKLKNGNTYIDLGEKTFDRLTDYKDSEGVFSVRIPIFISQDMFNANSLSFDNEYYCYVYSGPSKENELDSDVFSLKILQEKVFKFYVRNISTTVGDYFLFDDYGLVGDVVQTTINSIYSDSDTELEVVNSVTTSLISNNPVIEPFNNSERGLANACQFFYNVTEDLPWIANPIHSNYTEIMLLKNHTGGVDLDGTSYHEPTNLGEVNFCFIFEDRLSGNPEGTEVEKRRRINHRSYVIAHELGHSRGSALPLLQYLIDDYDHTTGHNGIDKLYCLLRVGDDAIYSAIDDPRFCENHNQLLSNINWNYVPYKIGVSQ